MIRAHLVALGLFAGLMIASRAQEVLPNGDFEKADFMHPGKPLHWEQPDGLGVQWTDAPDVPGAPPHGKAIRMDTSQSEAAMVESYKKAGLTQWMFPKPSGDAIAGSYGLSLYSDPIKAELGKVYKVTFDYYSEQGVAAKLWCRAYADVNGQKKRVYEGTIECGGGQGWQHISGEFHPTKHRPNVTEFKIMLYAFYPPGVAWFENVHVVAEKDDSAPVTDVDMDHTDDANDPDEGTKPFDPNALTNSASPSAPASTNSPPAAK
jgi:hypothetical protein